MDNQTLIFGIAILVIFGIAILFSKRMKGFFNENGFSIQTNNAKLKNNEIVIDGNRNKVKQDTNNKNSSEKNNKISVKGDEHQIEQDTKN